MANKSIKELPKATQIQEDDALPMQQGSVTKQVTGQTLTIWLTALADGHGGVSDFQKLSESGLEKTYQFLMADGTKYQFTVTDGNGIADFQDSFSGLVHTCKFIMDDGTEYSFKVSDGEKGDKGDNAYVHIRFASQKPTSSSSSMGTEPDAWMGVYSGNEVIAPTDPMDYTWVRVLGAQGATGDPATVTTNKTEYQVSTSGTIIPSGIWTTTIPPVPNGQFLWSRTTLQFNTGSANYIYGITRYGIDGTGAVSTVNGVSPDGSGNVELTAEQLQCLGLAGGTMTGPINMNGQAITGLNDPVKETDAVRKAYADKTYVAIAKNAGGHNAVYRGNELGTSVTPEQWAAIKAGSFDDMFIGDYWVIDGRKWAIAAFDYYLNSGDTRCTDHHVVIIPTNALYVEEMNSTRTTQGAYVGSEMYKTGLAQAKNIVQSAFGTDHILIHRNYLKNATTNGYESGGSWYDSTVELMTEQNVYGCKVYGNVVNGVAVPDNTTVDKIQYPIFAMRPDFLNGEAFFLRDVASTEQFAYSFQGNAWYTVADFEYGVFPSFCIYQA